MGIIGLTTAQFSGLFGALLLMLAVLLLLWLKSSRRRGAVAAGGAELVAVSDAPGAPAGSAVGDTSELDMASAFAPLAAPAPAPAGPTDGVRLVEVVPVPPRPRIYSDELGLEGEAEEGQVAGPEQMADQPDPAVPHGADAAPRPQLYPPPLVEAPAPSPPGPGLRLDSNGMPEFVPR